jgi:hypothetical protein
VAGPLAASPAAALPHALAVGRGHRGLARRLHWRLPDISVYRATLVSASKTNEGALHRCPPRREKMTGRGAAGVLVGLGAAG